MVSFFRGRARGANNLETRISDLQEDLVRLQKDLRGLAAAGGERASSRITEIVDGASGTARAAAGRAAEQLGDWTDESLSPVREQVKSQPLASVLLSIGAGALIGAILAAPRLSRDE